ncbi:MAG TPA: helix-turn-helix domain-containing protein [Candidatus Deferrimicrobium sp.]|nr:helix-turn-helix domain-containing protein [Candidatus Deferrimicrobium sp.]
MRKKMKILTRNFSLAVGQRIALIRQEHQYPRSEMALKLGIHPDNYYKNEIGYSIPGMDTLYRLHTDFDISLDWLFFGSEPMHNKEKQPVIAPEKKTPGLENESPHVRELLDDMAQDPLLMHEMMLNYFKYKQNKETPKPDTQKNNGAGANSLAPQGK